MDSMIEPYRISHYHCPRRLLLSNPSLVRCLAPPTLLFAFFLCFAPASARGQAVVEAAGATSVSGTAGSAVKPPSFPSVPAPEDKGKSPHLLAPTVQRPEVINRQALEQKAGSHPGKLLLRSTPSGAQTWVNGAFVGNAPLLLIVAPGKYQVEFRGQRMEHAARTVDLLPDETRTISIALSARYPTHASVR
jgi:PEGA domain